MPKTFAVTKKYQTGWYEIEDCRIMRKIALTFEVVTCHKFTYYLYIALIFSAILLFVIFVNTWMMFFHFRLATDENKVHPPK